MPKKIIGVDLDDVLLDFNTALCKWHNLTYNSSYKRADIFSFDLKDVWKCSQEETNKRIVEFYHSKFHTDSLPVPGSIEAVNKLCQNNDLVIITSKPEYLREQTDSWLKKYFADSFKSVHFTNSFHRNGSKRAKADVCDKLGVSVYIEDSIENAKAVVAQDRQVLLLNTPWNQAPIPDSLTRISSWDEIARIYA